jgi:hypothetical protein
MCISFTYTLYNRKKTHDRQNASGVCVNEQDNKHTHIRL